MRYLALLALAACGGSPFSAALPEPVSTPDASSDTSSEEAAAPAFEAAVPEMPVCDPVACGAMGGTCGGRLCCTTCWTGSGECAVALDVGWCGKGGGSCTDCHTAHGSCVVDRCEADGTCSHRSVPPNVTACDGGMCDLDGVCRVCGGDPNPLSGLPSPCCGGIGGTCPAPVPAGSEAWFCNPTGGCDTCGGPSHTCCPTGPACLPGYQCGNANVMGACVPAGS